MTLAEHFEEQFGAGLGEQHIAQFVDDEQLDGGQLRLKPEQAPFVARLHQLMHEPGRGIEGHGESTLAGGEAERQGDVGLSGSAVAQSDDVVAGDDKLASRQFQRERLIKRGNGGELERVEALDGGKAGGPDATLDHASFAIDELELDEAQEEADMIETPARGFRRDFLVFS